MKPNNKKQASKGKATTPKRSFWQVFDLIANSKWAICLMLVAMTFVFNTNYAKLYDTKPDLGGDNIVYYSLGQALSQGEGYTTIYTLNKSPHTHFPPGYPYFISKLIKVFPDSIITVKKANGFLLYLSLFALFFVIFTATNHSILAFCACILAAMHDELLRYATVMMSETLYIFLSLSAILIALLIVKNRIGAKRRWTFWIATTVYGLLVAYIYFVRTMGLSLIIALAAWTGLVAIRGLIGWIKASKKQNETTSAHKLLFVRSAVLCAVTIVAVGTAKLSWDARNRSLGATTGSAYKNTFFKKTNNEDMEGLHDWKVRVKDNSSNFVARWIPEVTYMKEVTMNPQDGKRVPLTTKEWATGLLLLLLIIGGSLYLCTGRFLMLFYIVFTVGVLIFYPEQFGGTRYITPIIPLFIFLSLNGLSALIAVFYKVFKVKHPPLFIQSVAVAFCTFLFLVPRYTAAQEDHMSTAKLKSWMALPDDYAPNVNIKNFITAARYCGDSLPEDARIICRKPELFYYFSKQRSSNGFPKYADPDSIYNMLCRDSINYLIIDNWYRHAYVTLVPCVNKYENKFKVIKQYDSPNKDDGNNPTYILYFNDFWGYHGELIDGVAEGEGVLNLQDGRTYKGHFANGLPNGQGTLYDADGNVIGSGIWYDGTLYFEVWQ